MFVLPWLCEAQDSQAPDTKPPTATSSAAIQPDAAQIVPGRLIHQVDPKYPKEARKENLEDLIDDLRYNRYQPEKPTVVYQPQRKAACFDH